LKKRHCHRLNRFGLCRSVTATDPFGGVKIQGGRISPGGGLVGLRTMAAAQINSACPSDSRAISEYISVRLYTGRAATSRIPTHVRLAARLTAMLLDRVVQQYVRATAGIGTDSNSGQSLALV
jgi:hypothetical protein